MKAAVVRELGRAPHYDRFPDPVAQPGEVEVAVSASAVSPLARSRSNGRHYSATAALPFVAGIDGTGRTGDGQRVYFAFPRSPFGSLAERTVVPAAQMVPLPTGLDDTLAAAAANPGMSCWVPLTGRAQVPRGESVLINGATGVAGQMAVQVAKHLGAARVIATGRDARKLDRLRDLGADVLIPLDGATEDFRAAVRREVRDTRVGVVLDYLWGPSAEAILTALGGSHPPRGSTPVRYVQVGSVSGPTVSLAAESLRSSGLEVLGTGLGSTSDRELLEGIGHFLAALASGRFRMTIDAHPLSDVERAWDRSDGDGRLVFTIP